MAIGFCLRRARGAGRTKPPEEHYAEAEGSSGRWTKAFPARRIFAAGPSRPAVFLLSNTQSTAAEPQHGCCEKERPQIARSEVSSALTSPGVLPRVRDAPSTERQRLMALRSAVASAAVSRKAGRRRHRLGAFLRARTRFPDLENARDRRADLSANCVEWVHRVLDRLPSGP